ncbi:MAG: zinc transporter ZupT [Deltaproteobacteria bacterium]|nr:zinc transporter ZupT [Deltaproteobacteria bacterium]
MDNRILLALGLTLLAGLSTGIGSTIAFFGKRSHPGFLSATLGFSAGVMIYIAFVEMLPGGRELLIGDLGESASGWWSMIAFFVGILLIFAIDLLVPSYENPHDAVLLEDVELPAGDGKHLERLGLFTALAVGVHNFPEGISTFFAAVNDPAVGVSIAIAVALHNIPEGISISVPVLYATGSKRKAFIFSFLSGISEPIGALLGWALLAPFLSDSLQGLVYSGVAGVMVFISLDQMLPNAKKYGQGHESLYGLIAGMAVMAITLQLL